jgi:hypothetical protein
MTAPTPEQEMAWADEDERLENGLVALAAAVGNALKVCSYGLTIGEAYVPFDPDDEDECEPEETEDGELLMCEQAWVRVASVQPISGGVSALDGEACDSVLRLELEVGVLRCIEVPQGGEAPKASDVLVAAIQSMRDMQAIRRAAENTEVWDALIVGQWVPNGPLGGQYGGVWTFTVEV